MMKPAWIVAATLVAACDRPAAHIALPEVLLEQVASVGVVQGDEAQEFARITDVRAAPDASYFVLDGQSRTIRWFTVYGESLGGIVASGSGPGELASPSALDVSSADRLTIVDPGNARLSVYRFGSDGLRHEADFRGPWSVFTSGRNICSIAQRLYVREPRGGFLIHEIGQDGEIVHSFDEAPPTSPEEFGPFAPIIAQQRNSGHLHCLEDPPLLLSMSEYLPHVRAFTGDGELLWATEVTDFRPVQITASPETGVRYAVDPANGSHMGQSIVRWGDNVLVQYSISPELGGPSDRDFFSLESRELSLATGQELGRSLTLPLIVESQREFVYSLENLPYPRVKVLRRRN